MIFIDEIDTLTRHRVASDTASTYATKSTLLSLWSTLQHQGDRVVVVCITKNPSRIDPAFLARLTTKIWVRGPEAAERFAMAKSMLANVYHEVYLEPTPLTIQGTTSLYGLLTGAHKDHSISKLTGAEIANAIESATTAAWDELVETRAWVKVSHIPCIIPHVTKSVSIGGDWIALPRCITYGQIYIWTDDDRTLRMVLRHNHFWHTINYLLPTRSRTKARSF